MTVHLHQHYYVLRTTQLGDSVILGFFWKGSLLTNRFIVVQYCVGALLKMVETPWYILFFSLLDCVVGVFGCLSIFIEDNQFFSFSVLTESMSEKSSHFLFGYDKLKLEWRNNVTSHPCLIIGICPIY